MALLALADVILLNEFNQNEQNNHLRIEHRMLRDNSDPFNLPNIRFTKLFRLSKESTRMLIHQVEPYIPLTTRQTAIPAVLKILVALHFFGHGSYQLDVGGVYNFGMSQPSVSRCISLIVNIINDHLLQMYIKFPNIEAIINIKKQQFLHKYNFPNTLGCIDCTHIAIIAPPSDHPIYPPAPYYNRKGFYSINTQIICDADLNILNINARFPGSVHDSAIWNSSNVKDHVRLLYINDRLNFHLIGDSGYPLQPWMMVPFADVIEGSSEARFNDQLSIAGNSIERVNGVLKSRFRCLLKHRTLNYNPEKSAKIIYSCAVLHNICRYFNDELPNDVIDDDDLNLVPQVDFNPNFGNLIDNNVPRRGQDIRNNIVNNFFRI